MQPRRIQLEHVVEKRKPGRDAVATTSSFICIQEDWAFPFPGMFQEGSVGCDRGWEVRESAKGAGKCEMCERGREVREIAGGAKA